MMATERLICAACGAAITGSYFRLRSRNEPFCMRCAQERPRCASCGAPLGMRHWRLHDGRLLCDRCNSTAVYDPAEAHRLYDETVAAVVAQLGLNLRIGVVFRLIDAPSLARIRSENGAHDDEPVLGLYHRYGRTRAIYMLYGLPRLTFRTVVAHEYAHAWQGENCPLLDDEALREGFAEWVAYRHLSYLGCHKAAAEMLASSHPYRPFLEQMLAIERRAGPAGVLQHMLAGGRHPGA